MYVIEHVQVVHSVCENLLVQAIIAAPAFEAFSCTPEAEYPVPPCKIETQKAQVHTHKVK